MSVEENKALVRRFFAAFNAQDAAALAALATPEVAESYVGAVRWTVETYGAEHHIEPIELVGEGDTVMVRVASRGGHTGTWQGIPPTGKQWTNKGYGHFRIADGKIAEAEFAMDRLGHLQQLGATVAPPT